MSLKDEMNRDAEEHGLGGNTDFFNFSKSGDYRLRILTKPLAMATHFFGKGQKGHVCYGKDKGCPFHGKIMNLTEAELAERIRQGKDDEYENPTLKYQCYVIDRADGKVKLAEIPWSVVSVVGDLELDSDYAYEGYPMPYDIKVKVDKENKDPKQIYKTLGSPTRDAITTEEENELVKKLGSLPVEKYISERKTKQAEMHKETGIFVTEEQRAEREEARLEEGRRVAMENGLGDMPAIEYPTEDIDPADITFDGEVKPKAKAKAK